MIEYRIEARRGGKWVGAHAPNNCYTKTIKERQDAERELKKIKDAWRRYKEKWAGYIEIDNLPSEFRIVSREVTKWKEV